MEELNVDKMIEEVNKEVEQLVDNMPKVPVAIIKKEGEDNEEGS